MANKPETVLYRAPTLFSSCHIVYLFMVPESMVFILFPLQGRLFICFPVIARGMVELKIPEEV